MYPCTLISLILDMWVILVSSILQTSLLYVILCEMYIKGFYHSAWMHRLAGLSPCWSCKISMYHSTNLKVLLNSEADQSLLGLKYRTVGEVCVCALHTKLPLNYDKYNNSSPIPNIQGESFLPKCSWWASTFEGKTLL